MWIVWKYFDRMILSCTNNMVKISSKAMWEYSGEKGEFCIFQNIKQKFADPEF